MDQTVAATQDSLLGLFDALTQFQRGILELRRRMRCY
ncbi:hypothetical protein pipiens_000708 [Culex pipiens pipiens]|uniref:Uncharacterized protein n=1 Tax=Culex pipiens pipiens TaxID=38569 RepID=A0ABD1CH95_CULPP